MEQVYLYFGIVAFWLCTIAATGFVLYWFLYFGIRFWRKLDKRFELYRKWRYFVLKKSIPTEYLRSHWQNKPVVWFENNRLWILRYRFRNIQQASK